MLSDCPEGCGKPETCWLCRRKPWRHKASNHCAACGVFPFKPQVIKSSLQKLQLKKLKGTLTMSAVKRRKWKRRPVKRTERAKRAIRAISPISAILSTFHFAVPCMALPIRAAAIWVLSGRCEERMFQSKVQSSRHHCKIATQTLWHPYVVRPESTAVIAEARCRGHGRKAASLPATGPWAQFHYFLAKAA